MSAFRVSAGIAAAALLTAAQALAQAPGPVRLMPPADSPSSRPAPAAPPRAAEAPGTETAVPRSAEVEVDRLEAPDPDSVGVLDPADGGLPSDLWRDTDRALAGRLLARLPAPQRSAALRALVRRLLLTRAAAPQNRGEGAAGASLLAVRVERLLAMGAVHDALALVQVAPPSLTDETLARIETETLFFDNDNAGACNRVQGGGRDYDGLFWRQAQAFCLALSGKTARAVMIADLLREREAELPAAFFAMVEALGGNRDVTIESLPNPGGLDLAMMRAANLALPADALAAGRPAPLRAIAFSPNAELPLRLAAAERAAALGALDPSELADLYGAVKVEPAELAAPFEAAEARWGPEGRAVLLRGAAAKPTAQGRAEALMQAWRAARERGDNGSLERASLPLLLAIAPSPDLLWFAEDAGRALFAAGRVEEAMAWYRLAAAEASANPEAAAAEVALWPLAQVADAGGMQAWSPEKLIAWHAAMRTANAETYGRRAARVFGVMEALGYDVPIALWASLVDVGPSAAATRTGPALMPLMRKASIAGRLGETVLFVAIALGGDGLESIGAGTLSESIAALRRVGLEGDARALALEALAARGG